MIKKYLLEFVFFANIFLVVGDETEYELVQNLFQNYDPSIRPSINHKLTLNVTFGVALTQLIDVDERNMIITTNCWLNQNWIDNKLRWNPKNYNFIKSIHVPAERIWKPDILLVNNADSWAKISSISTNAFIKYDGNVTWLSTVIFKSSCSINVRYFPFDVQICDMIFASWTFDGFLIDIIINSQEGDITNYIKNGEWHLVNFTAIKVLKTYSCCEEPYPEVIYRLVMRRRPLYYVFNMVFPCLLITMVAFLGFFLPPSSTEKVSMGITTLLSITVYLMLVAESMPPTSEQLPLLGIYYAVTIGIVSLSTAMAVVTLNINNKGIQGKRVPRVFRIIFFKYLSKLVRNNLFTTKHPKVIDFAENRTLIELNKKPIYSIINLKSNENEQDFGFSIFNEEQVAQNEDFDRSSNHTLNTNSVSYIINRKSANKKYYAQKKLFEKETKFLEELEIILSRQFSQLINILSDSINKNNNKQEEKRRLRVIQNEWSDLAIILDQILCYSFVLITLLSCFLIFFNSPHFLSEW